jgi:ubiquinone/menaquinone biosynthesis C-methylase UbiE
MKTDWDAVWDRKAASDSLDAQEISGFTEIKIDAEATARLLADRLELSKNDRVLEIGCAAGTVGAHLRKWCEYVAVDRSAGMVEKAIQISRVAAIRCPANDLLFKDKSFDKVFSFGVFHYFPDHAYARQVLAEMQRVARTLIMVSDIPIESHDPTHTLYPESFFDGWELSGPVYQREHRRFTARRKL